MSDFQKTFDPIDSKIEFSAIITCYFEEKSIQEFHSRLSASLEALGRPYEILYVNDGSTDATFELLEEIFERDTHVTAVVDLMKNVGQSNAKTPGVMLATGRGLILLDSDLQLDPEELPILVEEWDRGMDLVSGYRTQRQEGWRRSLPSKLANVIMRRASKSTLRDFGCTFKIYDSRLTRAFSFNQMRPWRAVPVIAEARQVAEVPVTHHPRRYGVSGWTFRKLFAYNMENLIAVSDRPFQWLGAVCLGLATLLSARVALEFIWNFQVLSRVTDGLVLNVLIAGILILLAVVAILGEFVIRNHIVLQRRPSFIVRSCRRRDPADA